MNEQEAEVITIKKDSRRILVIPKDFIKINFWHQTIDTAHPSDD
jgi:hypothetical protein